MYVFLCNAECFLFDKDIGIAIKKAHYKDFDSNTMYIAPAAQITWTELFETHSSFNGSFSAKYYNECVFFYFV